MLNKMQEKYFNWLCNYVNFGKLAGYYYLANKLQNSDFIFFIERDNCRMDDGLELRNEFIKFNKCGNRIFTTDKKCSVLEMLIALSRRMDDICCDSLTNSNIDKWFWTLIDNLGLTKFSDEKYQLFGGDNEIDKILHDWMFRCYKKNGLGSVFPMKKCKYDMRKIEIGMQMHHYLASKNYHL